jgi:hypothetical protein
MRMGHGIYRLCTCGRNHIDTYTHVQCWYFSEFHICVPYLTVRFLVAHLGWASQPEGASLQIYPVQGRPGLAQPWHCALGTGKCKSNQIIYSWYYEYAINSWVRCGRAPYLGTKVSFVLGSHMKKLGIVSSHFWSTPTASILPSIHVHKVLSSTDFLWSGNIFLY